ncbi:acyl-CoA dehydrogenase family protein [Micromonospora andamanensis]|uniref:Acyl-CoA dehydrogenase n=1 Tax=Micromonospora andamanensis TaxID=1287068 RepID=A0ABQ4HTV6_9ACTN|nr:acyl-CoA dehydrogenase family protein [Micromonospora andamanensis]GIJ08961.1 acyl-CoA dehydrogenase [Micromonospora andamanensis]
MDLTLTRDQLDLREAARRFLGAVCPPATVAELADRREWASGTWPELIRQGWADPDLSAVELALLAGELGYALLPVPWWTTVGLALPVYQAAGEPLPGPATLVDRPDGSDTPLLAARRGAAGWRIDGVASAVDAGPAAEFVVAASTDGEVGLFAVPAGPVHVPTEGIDPLRVLGSLTFDSVPARLLVGPPNAAGLLARVRDRAAMLLAAEAVGVAERALGFAVEHAKLRAQFGRPIGSYQAVSHLLAECYAEVELARSLVWRAAAAHDGPAGGPADATASAVLAGRRAAVQSCEAAVQVCGGMGVTWDFPVHRWYRRALWLDGSTETLAAIADVVFAVGESGGPPGRVVREVRRELS